MTEKENMIDGNGTPEDPPVTPPSEEGVVPPILGPDMPTSPEATGNTGEGEAQVEGAESSEETLVKLFENIAAVDPEMAEKLRTGAGALGDEGKTAEELAADIKSAGIPRQYVADVLRAAGQDDEKINQVLADPNLPPDPVPHEETPEEVESVEHAMGPEGAVEDAKNLSEEGKAIEANPDATDEEIEEHNKKVSKLRARVNEFLFDGDRGLLRPEHRIRRLAVKPTVSLLLVLLITYAASLHIITKGSTKRIGSG